MMGLCDRMTVLDYGKPIAEGLPASILEFRRGETADMKLPTDSTEPLWKILIPNIGQTQIDVGDIVINQTTENFVINSNELTELGWNIQAKQVLNTR